MTAGSAVFLDTNVLVYATFPQFAWHRVACSRLATLAAAPVAFHTSRQVLREFLAAATRPGFMSPMPEIAFLADALRDFEKRFAILAEDGAVTARLVELLEHPGARGRQVHDANIVATMRRHGIASLLTHNPADFERYRSWITVLPLV